MLGHYTKVKDSKGFTISKADVIEDRQGNTLKLAVTGSIGETSGLFSSILQRIEHLVVNLQNVTYINSIGVKHWIQWTNRFPKNMSVSLSNCPSSIINQINIVDGFLPKAAIVESLYVPYYCDSCSTESTRLLSLGQDYTLATEDGPGEVHLPKDVKCAKCQAETHPDIILAKYFHFILKNK